MTCFIGGNSHIVALQGGLRADPELRSTMRLVSFGSAMAETAPFSRISGGRTEFTSDGMTAALVKGTGKAFFDRSDLWGICQGTHDARILRSGFLRADAVPSAIALAGQRPLSKALLEVFINADQAGVRQFLLNLKKTGVPVFVVSCAPVRANGRAAQMGVPLQTIGHVSAQGRQMFRDFLDRNGIDFVAPPPETMTADGFLKEEYCQMVTSRGDFDPHHANDAYGALMVQLIAAYLATSATSASAADRT